MKKAEVLITEQIAALRKTIGRRVLHHRIPNVQSIAFVLNLLLLTQVVDWRTMNRFFNGFCGVVGKLSASGLPQKGQGIALLSA